MKYKYNLVIFILLNILILFWIGKFLNINFYHYFSKIDSLIVFIIAIVIIVLILIENERQIKKKDVYIIIIMISILLFNTIFNKSNLGSIINAITFSLILIVSKYSCIKQKYINYILYTLVFYNIIWINSKYFFYNTNTIGLVAMIFLMWNSFIIYINKRIKLINIILIGLILKDIHIVLLSDSRGAMLGILMFYMILCIPNKLLKIDFIFNSLLTFFTLGSLFFVGIYTFIWKNNILENNFFYGKRIFTGREKIWYELFVLFKENIWIGLGSGIEIKSNSSLNVHNSMYNVLVIYGILIFSIIIYIIFDNLHKNKFIIANNKIGKVTFAFVCGLLANSFVETTFFNANIYMILLFLLIILNSERNMS